MTQDILSPNTLFLYIADRLYGGVCPEHTEEGVIYAMGKHISIE